MQRLDAAMDRVSSQLSGGQAVTPDHAVNLRSQSFTVVSGNEPAATAKIKDSISIGLLVLTSSFVGTK